MQSTIIYEDEYILVVNKPAGLAVQTDKIGEKDLLSETRKYLKSKGEAPSVFPVHRLDQPVSGLLVLAKTADSAAKLSEELKKDSFSKDYRARVYTAGNPTGSGPVELKDFMLKQKDNSSKVVPAGTKDAKEAVLTYETESSDDETATLIVHLKTGRHHQIRVQLSHAGLPILGDRKYGSPQSLALSEKLGIKNVALTAYKLKFTHPRNNAPMELTI